MLTFTLQCVDWFLMGVAGLLCLRVRVPQNPHRQAAWRLTGIAFLWHAISTMVQNAIGGTAMIVGYDSAVMDFYRMIGPAMNHSRTFLLNGFLVALLGLSFMRGDPGRGFWRAAWALMVLGFLGGAAMGHFEGPFTEARHYSAVVVWDVVELGLLMAAMFALLISNRADRLLWAFLSAYGLALALGVFWLSLLALLGLDTWTPKP
ncbi:MAG TPA: hypothetical protein VFS20_05290, partial [Longimicrobium sp.]|nr:hypothetical protein [Longimicrobium sp.]